MISARAQHELCPAQKLENILIPRLARKVPTTPRCPKDDLDGIYTHRFSPASVSYSAGHAREVCRFVRYLDATI